MDTTLGFTYLSKDELCDIDGGSTKVVAVVAVLGGIACGIGSYVASQTGHPAASAWLGAGAATCGLVAAWCAIAPSL